MQHVLENLAVKNLTPTGCELRCDGDGTLWCEEVPEFVSSSAAPEFASSAEEISSAALVPPVYITCNSCDPMLASEYVATLSGLEDEWAKWNGAHTLVWDSAYGPTNCQWFGSATAGGEDASITLIWSGFVGNNDWWVTLSPIASAASVVWFEEVPSNCEPIGDYGSNDSCNTGGSYTCPPSSGVNSCVLSA